MLSRILTSSIFLILIISGVIAYDYSVVIQHANALGAWPNNLDLPPDIYHVPISWCAVIGSPAEENPSLAGDTTTDAVLWRRHERPTDNFWLPDAGITFRSAINNVWGTGLSFPTIPDNDTAYGSEGDVLGMNESGGEITGLQFTEIKDLVQICRTQWAEENNEGNAAVGITSINARQFHDPNGNVPAQIGEGFTVPTIIGYATCYENATPGVNPGCLALYDDDPSHGIDTSTGNVINYLGWTILWDNSYLYPATPPGWFFYEDRFDNLAGHEFGHALDLSHRNDDDALMRQIQLVDWNDENAPPYLVSNHGLNDEEISSARTMAELVTGGTTDPPNVVLPGKVSGMRLMDNIHEEGLPEHLDLTSVFITLNKEDQILTFNQELFGLIPEKVFSSYWMLVNLDGDPSTGVTSEMLPELGLKASKFSGAELLIHVDVDNQKPITEIWQVQDKSLVKLQKEYDFAILTEVAYPIYAGFSEKKDADAKTSLLPPEKGIKIRDIIHVAIDNRLFGFALDKPFQVQTIIIQDGLKVVEKFDESEKERGIKFELKDIIFPQCFPQSDVKVGETVKVTIDGFAPHDKLHGLLGADEVFVGKADNTGGGTIDFPIPKDSEAGLRLVTIGKINTALTADCAVNVTEKEQVVKMPDWVRNNAKWWVQGSIGDSDFTLGIEYLIEAKVIQLPETTKSDILDGSKEIPHWIKNNADWWSQGLISDEEFIKGIQFLVKNGIIRV